MLEYYWPAKRNNLVVPKILGLSATPAAKLSLGDTLLHLLALCHDLDCKVRKITKHENELKHVIAAPNLKDIEVPMLEASIHVAEILNRALTLVKKHMVKTDDDVDWTELQKIAALQKQDIPLVQYAKALATIMDSLQMNDNRSPFAAWSNFAVYLNSLEMNSPVKKTFDSHKISSSLFDFKSLPTYCSKYVKLVEMLQNYSNIPHFRAIVFVSTKIGAHELCEFLANSPVASFVRSEILIGHKSSTNIGMTGHQQQEIIKHFTSGTINVIIATSVAEEGLDIPACNVVFRLHSIFHAHQLIQTRGRARSKESDFYLIFHKESKDMNRAACCLHQEHNMYLAISILVQAESIHPDPYLHALKMQNTEPITVNARHLWTHIWQMSMNQETAIPQALVKYKVTPNISSMPDAISALRQTCDQFGVSPVYVVYQAKRENSDLFFGTVRLPVCITLLVNRVHSMTTSKNWCLQQMTMHKHYSKPSTRQLEQLSRNWFVMTCSFGPVVHGVKFTT